MMKVTQNRLNKRFQSWLELVQREQLLLSATAEREIEIKEAALISFENQLVQVKERYSSQALEKYPAIVFHHQIPHTNKPHLKFQIEELRRKGKIMVFNLAMCTPSKALVFIRDLIAWVKQFNSTSQRMSYFIQQVLPRLRSSRVHKSELTDLNVTDRDIKDLINSGFLVYIQESVYELTIPCAGEYSKIFLKGRNALLAVLNRSPDKELLKVEIQKNDNIRKRTWLGLDFHINDIVGLKLADCIETTSGQLIRYLNID